MTLAILLLAVLWAWEFLLVLSPWRVPAQMQPLLGAGLAFGATYVRPELLQAAAIAGVVAFLHLIIRRVGEDGPILTRAIGRPRERPSLSRVPPLP